MLIAPKQLTKKSNASNGVVEHARGWKGGSGHRYGDEAVYRLDGDLNNTRASFGDDYEGTLAVDGIKVVDGASYFDAAGLSRPRRPSHSGGRDFESASSSASATRTSFSSNEDSQLRGVRNDRKFPITPPVSDPEHTFGSDRRLLPSRSSHNGISHALSSFLATEQRHNMISLGILTSNRNAAIGDLIGRVETVLPIRPQATGPDELAFMGAQFDPLASSECPNSWQAGISMGLDFD